MNPWIAAVSVLTLAVGVGPAGAEPDTGLTVTTEIVRHDVTYLDDAGVRPGLYSYTGGLVAENHGEPVTEDWFAEPARLARDELVPGTDPDLPLPWRFAGRGVPMRVDLQDDVGVQVLTPARADPYATDWYHRQEVATDFWSWGGVLSGGQVHGTVSAENAVFGAGPRPVAYPEQDAGPGVGRLEWQERTLTETAETTQHDPVTGEDYTGTFAGAFAMPSLRVVGGDAVFEEDTEAPPVVVELPVRPHGGVFFNSPPAPPGVEVTWSRTLDFDAQTLTLTATVRAGSVWPESGVAEDDPTVATWTWTPWAFFYGWDYRGAASGSLQAPPGLGAGGLPDVPAGLLEANLPPGTFFETWTGERADVGGLRLPTAPGTAPSADGESEGGPEPTASVVERDGVTGLAFGKEGERIGELFVPHVTIDGAPHLLDASTTLDRFVQEPADPSGHGAWYIISLHRVDGLFLSLLLEVSHSQTLSYAAYHLWDAHSVDARDRTVALHVFLDPKLNGGERNFFVEPFYTGSTYEEESFVPQGIRNQADSFLHGWWSSFPAIETRDDGGAGSIIHAQYVPALGQSGHEDASLASGAYLLANDGSFHPDPAANLDTPQNIDRTDVALVLVNEYEGTIWHRDGLQWFSWFMY